MAINSLSASSYGMSGLASGMNTQDIVEQMLSGTQAKIDSTMQDKMTLETKQAMYREVSSKLKALQSSFLSFTSSTNLLSNSFYNTMTSTVTASGDLSAAFSVTASSQAFVGTTSLDYIQQLASARTEKTNVDASAGVAGQLNSAAAKNLLDSYRGEDAVLTIKVGEQSVNIDDAPLLFSGKSQSEVAAILNQKFADEGMGAEARFVNNELQIIADDPDAYIEVYGNQNTTSEDPTLSMKMFGSGIDKLSGQGEFTASINTELYQPSFEVNLDGRQQTINLDLNALNAYANGGDNTELLNDINTQLKRYFGAGVTAEVDSLGRIEFNAGAKSQKFTITGEHDVVGIFGVVSGISNKLNTNLALKDLNFAEPLQGSHHVFMVNGIEFAYDSDASLGTIINDINGSKAGVKISYLEAEDRFVVQSSETGAGSMEFEVSQTEGNLMSVLFGEKGANTAIGYGINMDMTSQLAVTDADIANGGSFTFNINGNNYNFKVSRDNDEPQFTLETFTEEMNKAFENTFGTSADGTQEIEFLQQDGKFTIRANNDDFVVKAVEYDENTNTHMLGFVENQSTLAADASFTLSETGISFGEGASIDIEFGAHSVSIDSSELAGNLTIQGVENLINSRIREELGITDNTTMHPFVSFDENSGAFRLTTQDGMPMTISMNEGTGTGAAASTGLDKLFGAQSISVGHEPELPAGATEFRSVTDEGRNAIFSYEGSVMERASNSFTINGLTFTLNNTTVKNTIEHAAVGTEGDADYVPAWTEYEYHEPTSITTTRDTDKIVDGIVEYLALYNETVNYITELVRADATYKDYPPLTDEQKSAMSDREIELWEEKAQEGLLRNDLYLERVLQDMRSAMYTQPDASSIAIYDLGISTSFYSSDGNFNAESIDDLRAAIENDPEAVRQLFAGEGGIMELVNDAINSATTSSYGSPGYITAVAGSSALDTSSTIYKEIEDLDEQLLTLEDRYWSEYDRYWSEFNAMELLIQEMNSQSSWLSQQLA